MKNNELPIWPSQNLKIFKQQLLQTATEEITSGTEKQDNPFQNYLLEALGRGFVAAVHRDKDYLTKLTDVLREVLIQLMEINLNNIENNPIIICLSLVIKSLNIGYSSLEAKDSMVKLLEEPYVIPILEHLAKAKTYLTRNQIADAIKAPWPRVGYTLNDMRFSGLLLSYEAPNGPYLTRYYAISQTGLSSLCDNSKLI